VHVEQGASPSSAQTWQWQRSQQQFRQDEQRINHRPQPSTTTTSQHHYDGIKNTKSMVAMNDFIRRNNNNQP
jgi:hypothetical protein